jgi:hypothetical protein
MKRPWSKPCRDRAVSSYALIPIGSLPRSGCHPHKSQKPARASILRPGPCKSPQPPGAGAVEFMADQTEMAARLQVWAMYRATDAEYRWWDLPTKLNDLTKDAIAVAVDRGWMLDRGDTVCLTDAGQGSGDLVAIVARRPIAANNAPYGAWANFFE